MRVRRVTRIVPALVLLMLLTSMARPAGQTAPSNAVQTTGND